MRATHVESIGMDTTYEPSNGRVQYIYIYMEAIRQCASSARINYGLADLIRSRCAFGVYTLSVQRTKKKHNATF